MNEGFLVNVSQTSDIMLNVARQFEAGKTKKKNTKVDKGHRGSAEIQR